MSDQLRTDIKVALDKERNRLIDLRTDLLKHNKMKTAQAQLRDIETNIELIEEYNDILTNVGPCFLTIKRPFDPSRIRL